MAWWEVVLPQSTLIRSILVVQRHEWVLNRNGFEVRVGDLSPPSSNPLCVTVGTGTNAIYECVTALTGTKLGISRTNSDYIDFREIMAWSEYFVQ